MKIIKTILISTFLAGVFVGTNAIAAVNLAPNSTLDITDADGNPTGWNHGGYGENTRKHLVVPCRYYEYDGMGNLWIDGTYYPNEIIRGTLIGKYLASECPIRTRQIINVASSAYKNGDAKWYFSDVPIGKNKDFTVSYDYQRQSYTPTLYYALARYTLANGKYRYVPIGGMPQLEYGSHGSNPWGKATHQFTAPHNAKSLTIFFTVEGDGLLSIANVILIQ